MKYVTEGTLEVISEAGRLEMMNVDNVQGTIDELDKLGYDCFVDESTDYLVCTKREWKNDFIKSLARIEIDADRGLEDVVLDSYQEWIKEKANEYGVELTRDELLDIWEKVEKEIEKEIK
jgi:hypothetical protein